MWSSCDLYKKSHETCQSGGKPCKMESSANGVRFVHDCINLESEDSKDKKYLLVSTTSSSDKELQKKLGLEEFRSDEVEAELLKNK